MRRFGKQAYLLILLAATGAAAQTAVTNNNDGASGAVPVYTGSSTVGNSPISVSGSNVGIGITSPTTQLDVVSSQQTSTTINSNTVARLSSNANGADATLQITDGVANNYFVSGAQGNMYFSSGGVAPTPQMTILGTGNVGIGTTNPGATLEVNGSVKLTSGSGASMTYADGTVQSTAWNGTTLGGDYAESIDVLGDRAKYEPGDVIVIDDSVTGKFNKSAVAYSKLVAGVYSTKPGLVGRRLTTDRPDKAGEVPMAMIGIVPTKVSTENDPIERGDLLVSSNIPGYAMKGTDRDRLAGAVIGKALAPLQSGSGVIEVLLALQ